MKLDQKPNKNREVVLAEKDFREIVKYIRQLEDANRKLNKQIEEYNQLFAKDDAK